jgi:hypothetical protein
VAPGAWLSSAHLIHMEVVFEQIIIVRYLASITNLKVSAIMVYFTLSVYLCNVSMNVQCPSYC